MSSFRQLMMRKKTQTLNATVVGSPTISSDFVVSNINLNNYLYINNVQIPTSDNFTIQLKFQRKDGGSVPTQPIIWLNTLGQIGFSTYRGYWWFWWFGVDAGASNTTAGLGKDIWYWLRIVSFSSGETKFYISTTGAFAGEEVLLLSATRTTSGTITSFRLGCSNSEYINADIDMKECWAKKTDGTYTYWQGVI